MHPNPQNLHELKIHIQDAFDTFAMQMSSVRNENDYHFDVCRITNWAQIEIR